MFVHNHSVSSGCWSEAR